MKLSKSLTTSLAATALAASTAFAPVNAAEFGGVDVSASAGVANMYLWRGFDLGNGDAAVFGDITASVGGFYGGIWGSSGDASLGNEYDLYLGYGGEVGDFFYDVSVWNYNYPDAGLNGDGFESQDSTIGELSEVLLTLGYGWVSFTYYDNIAGASEYSYATIDVSVDKFSASLGAADQADAEGSLGDPIIDSDGNILPRVGTNYMHLNLSYAYNDNLSFTLSKIIDDDAEDTNRAVDDNVNFLVSYSFAIE